MIKVLMLDYNGVVGFWYEDKFISNLSKIYSLSKDVVKDLLYGKNGKFQEYETGKITLNEFHNLFCKKAGKVIPPEKYFKALNGVYEDDKKIVSYLKELKKEKKIKFAIAENAGPADPPWQKKNLKSLKLFDYIFFSADMKTYKSNPNFFKKCLTKLKIKPEEVFFFEDKQENVDSAAKTGIKAFLFTGLNEFKDIIKNTIK